MDPPRNKLTTQPGTVSDQTQSTEAKLNLASDAFITEKLGSIDRGAANTLNNLTLTQFAEELLGIHSGTYKSVTDGEGVELARKYPADKDVYARVTTMARLPQDGDPLDYPTRVEYDGRELVEGVAYEYTDHTDTSGDYRKYTLLIGSVPLALRFVYK